MKKVFAAGSFILLHPGHLYFLQQARQLGDHLTVVIANDDTVQKKRGTVLVPAEDRRTMVAALRCVDNALVGNPGDIFSILNKVRPDVIALGYDQDVDISSLKKRAQAYGLQLDIRRIPKAEGYSSSVIARRIKKSGLKKE